MPEEMKPAYLLAGTDTAKIDAARGRLRARAESEGGPAALHVFEADEGRGAPDHEAVLAAIPALSLTEARRYLLVDGVERWRDPQHKAVAAALGTLPPDLTVVLIARGKVPAALGSAVKKAGGEVLAYEAPRPRDLPGHLAAEAKRLGFRLEPAAARLLAERMGGSSLRLGHELERLALWAGPGGEVSLSDLEAMVADTSEAAVWSLSDALLDRDPEAAVRISDRLLAQGENVTGLVYCARLAAPKGVRGARPPRVRGAAQDGRAGPRHAPLRGAPAALAARGGLRGGPPRRDGGARGPRGLVPGRGRLRR